jgi:hypothetical protein
MSRKDGTTAKLHLKLQRRERERDATFSLLPTLQSLTNTLN